MDRNVQATNSKLTSLLQGSNQLPIPRCKAYTQLGLTRSQGARLAQILEFGDDQPFTPSQFHSLRSYADRIQLWRQSGLKFPRFLETVKQELQEQNQEQNNG